MTLWVRFRSQDGRVCCGALEAAGVREYSGDCSMIRSRRMSSSRSRRRRCWHRAFRPRSWRCGTTSTRSPPSSARRRPRISVSHQTGELHGRPR